LIENPIIETMLLHDQQSLLGLRMKPTASELRSTANYEDALDSLHAMMKQDRSYKTRDYLGRRRKRSPDNLSPDEAVDAACREKMIEWSYRVSDHFNVSREIVAVSSSFLDRFIDKCCCDRTAFKLASMASLYIATKILNSKQISLASLAELSRGEFSMEHLAEMERIILESLEWKMSPPTVQAFIEQLCPLLPVMDENLVDSVIDHAFFYAELCIYDYSFVTQDRFWIAIACIANALQGIEDAYIAEGLQQEFLSSASKFLPVNVDPVSLEKLQARLWYLYSCSAESQFEVQQVHLCDSQALKQVADDDSSCFTRSPVSVASTWRQH
jgi:hypothetical protein